MRRIFIWGVLVTFVSLPLWAVTITDFEGREITVSSTPKRIVSLAPIATRVMAQFDILDNVIGVDDKSFKMDLLPSSISQRKNNIINLGNAKSPNEEAILRLHPDIVITQYDAEAADRLFSRINVPIVCIQNRNDMDYALYELLGHVFFCEKRASDIVSYMKGMVDKAREISIKTNAHPRVYVATDTTLLKTFPQDPIITMCGGINAAGNVTAMNYWGGATVDAEFLVRCKPDILVVWIPFDKPQNLEKLKTTIQLREFAIIPAIKNKRIYSFLEANGGKDYFYTMVSISETLYHLYPDVYTRQMMERDVREHLNLFYPDVSYSAYKSLRDKITITP